MHIHLDAVGGIAGDMFAGALLDLDPSRESLLQAALGALGLTGKVALRRVPRGDGVLTGSGLGITVADTQNGHAHTHYGAIRGRIDRSGLSAPVKARAQDIFARLARAEAQVHGVAAEAVAFHEVGALDSILDIVAAAVLIEAVGASTWSVSPIPLGSGRTGSQHGTLPLPAPATLRLLHGLSVHDDGIPGERVTPTGAAILAHLQPISGWPGTPMRLEGSGTGFGTRRLNGVPNILRAMALRECRNAAGDQIVQLAFEVDDQSPEDLAVGLDRIRGVAGVRDVITLPAIGKKGRSAFAVRVLCDPAEESAVAAACFAQTTTLGIRRQMVGRHVLARDYVAVDGIGVKRVQRPAGRTAKAEIDDLGRTAPDHARRAQLAAAVCRDALDRAEETP